MKEIKFTSHKQYSFGLLFSIKVKDDSYRPKYTSSFLICPNLNNSQTFKSSSCKNFFLRYVIDATYFDERFLFHVITGRRYFSKSLSLPWDFLNRHIVVFFETSVLKEVRILRYFHNKCAVLILMLSSKIKISVLYLYILEKLSQLTFFMITFFTLFYFLTVSHFSLRVFLFFFLKNSKHLWKHVFT